MIYPFTNDNIKKKKRKKAVNRDNGDENLCNNLSQDINIPRVSKDYLTWVSEEVEGRVTRQLFQ